MYGLNSCGRRFLLSFLAYTVYLEILEVLVSIYLSFMKEFLLHMGSFHGSATSEVLFVNCGCPRCIL